MAAAPSDGASFAAYNRTAAPANDCLIFDIAG